MTHSIHVPADPERIRAFEATGLKKLDALIEEAAVLARSRSAIIEKQEGMLDLAERICKTITPYTPCTKGCNHCCHMATAVSSFEAAMIGRYLGRNPAPAGTDPIAVFGQREDWVETYTGVACTLLGTDGKCTVYPVRPASCRLHHNLAKDENNCRIAGVDRNGGLPETPALNLTEFEMARSLVSLMADDTYADVREWFPRNP